MAKRLFLFIFCGFLLLLPLFLIANADELDDITKQLDSLKKDLQDKEVNYQNLNKQLDDIRARVSDVESQIVQKEKEVKVGEAALSYQRDLLNERARSYYKNINKNAISIVSLLTSENLSISLNNFFYQKTVVDQDRNAITKIVRYIKDLETKREELKSEKSRLAVINEEVDKQAQILAGEISTTRQKVIELTAKQQQILASRLAALNIPRSAGTSLRGCSDDRGINPGFSPRFAFFTYGAPHRNGLNQYGAFGRAKNGQSDETILQAYYPNMSLTKDYDKNFQINVDGHGAFSIEDYMKHIFEVPNSWGDEGGMAALRAQAVAARTYAINSQQRNGHICTSESCQVFHTEEKGGNWAQAVSDTAGWVLIDGGNPGFTQYASTHGGYIRNLGKFDGDGGNPGSFEDLNSRAWDKESPWFYCDWGSRSQYSNTAWLREDEVVDIVNTLLLVKKDASATEHLYQTDKPNPAGTDNWDAARVRQELGGGAFTSISSISVAADFGGGSTSSITVSGNRTETFSGSEFKDRFNLRAPANIQIVGPLYNVERQ